MRVRQNLTSFYSNTNTLPYLGIDYIAPISQMEVTAAESVALRAEASANKRGKIPRIISLNCGPYLMVPLSEINIRV